MWRAGATRLNSAYICCGWQLIAPNDASPGGTVKIIAQANQRKPLHGLPAASGSTHNTGGSLAASKKRGALESNWCQHVFSGE